MKTYTPNRTRHWVHIVVGGVPVVILVFSYIFDLFNLPTTYREPSIVFGRFIFDLIAVGLVTMIIASLPGLVDYSALRAEEPIRTTARLHLVFNGLAFLMFAGSLLSRWEWPIRLGPPLVPLYLSTFGVGFLGYACYLGYRIMSPAITNPNDDLISYDRMVESRPPQLYGTPPGATVQAQWKKQEADEQRQRLEPRVDADGKSI